MSDGKDANEQASQGCLMTGILVMAVALMFVGSMCASRVKLSIQRVTEPTTGQVSVQATEKGSQKATKPAEQATKPTEKEEKPANKLAQALQNAIEAVVPPKNGNSGINLMALDDEEDPSQPATPDEPTEATEPTEADLS